MKNPKHIEVTQRTRGTYGVSRKQPPWEVTSALRAVGLSVHRRNNTNFLTPRTSNACVNTSRATQPRSSGATHLNGSSNTVPVPTDHVPASPAELIQEVGNSVRDRTLSRFLQGLMNDPMVRSALTSDVGGGDTGGLFPIQFIQKAAHMCSNAQIRTPQEKDLVIVAIVIRGLTWSVGKGICCKPNHEGCLHRVLSQAFRHLSKTSYAMDFTLKQLLQWGDDWERDEMLEDTRAQTDKFLAESYAQWEAKK